MRPAPWQAGKSLSAEAQAGIRRRAIFECCKWDPQVEDVCTLAPAPLIISRQVWRELAELASRLAAETLAMEAELLQRPELHGQLALPRALRKHLRRAQAFPSADPAVRVMRFDFHWTTEGWSISETNSDVPGGFVEAGGVAALVAEHFNGTELPGNPTVALTEAFRRKAGAEARVGLVHATAFTDDRQVMVYLARHLERAGLHPHLVAPDHLVWRDDRPALPAEWGASPLDLLFRFFPAEWLPDLPARSAWPHLLGRARVPLCNPATALLTQSKRLPLVWDQLQTPHPTWLALLPETRDPREVNWQLSNEWVVKPALGRVGDLVGIVGVTRETEWRGIRPWLRWHASHWVAQRRFAAVPVTLADQPGFPCLGVYTVGTEACGIYGRIARRPLIDHSAQDIAVLLEPRTGAPLSETHVLNCSPSQVEHHQNPSAANGGRREEIYGPNPVV